MAFLYGIDNTGFRIGDIRIRLFHIFVILFAIAVVIEYFIVKKEVKNILGRLFNKENRYSLFVMSIWFLYALISFFWVQSSSYWQSAIRFFIIGIFCTITFSLFLTTKKDIFHAFQIMGVIAIIHNIIGWFEVLTPYHLFYEYIRWGNRPVSLFGNTNNFAAFLFLSVFILFALGENSNNMVLKISYTITSASSAILIYFTQSRGTLLGLIFGVIILIALSSADKIKTKKNLFPKRILATFLTIATITVVAVLVYMLTIGLDTSNGGRVNVIQNGFAFLFQTNGFGVGAGNIEYWMDTNRYFIHFRNNPREMHNWWMEILTAYGVVIFFFYVIFYYKLLRNNLVKFAKGSNQIDKSLSKAMICIMGGFIIVSTVPDTLFVHPFHWVFWAVAIAFQGVILRRRNI